MLVLVGVAAVGSLVIRARFLAQGAARAAWCRGHLTQIGLALHNYQAMYDMLPRDLELAAYAANPDDPHLPLPSSLHPAGVNVLMADGRTYSLSRREVRRRLLEMAKRREQRTVEDEP